MITEKKMWGLLIEMIAQERELSSIDLHIPWTWQLSIKRPNPLGVIQVEIIRSSIFQEVGRSECNPTPELTHPWKTLTAKKKSAPLQLSSANSSQATNRLACSFWLTWFKWSQCTPITHTFLPNALFSWKSRSDHIICDWVLASPKESWIYLFWAA